LDAFWHQYRVHQQWKRKQEENALSSAFAVYVYNAPYMCISALMDYFKTVETNDALRQVIHAPPLLAELRQLVFNTVFLGANPALSFWFVVFEDVWYCNNKLRALKTPAARLLFDPCTPSNSAIRVRPLSREELIERLHNATVKRLFPQGLLDCIYHKMEKLFYASPEGAQAAQLWEEVKRARASLAPAPRSSSKPLAVVVNPISATTAASPHDGKMFTNRLFERGTTPV
jgi:hypothetical protein